MNLISQIFFAMLAKISTGTLALGIWLAVSRIAVRWNPRLPYLLLRSVCLLYILPVSYICMQLAVRRGYLQVAGIWQMNFALAGGLRELIAIIIISWTFLTGRQICVCLFSWKKKKRRCCSIPEDDTEILAELARIRKKLRIRRKIAVYRNRALASPRTQGIFCCRVELPLRHYSKEQLTVIFHHELMHCRSFDIFYKLCSRYVRLVYHLGFLGSRLEELLSEWSEYDCDMRAIAAIRDEMSVARYFEMIIDSMDRTVEERDVDVIFSGLYDNRHRMERRMDYMKKYGNIKRAASGMTALAVGAFVLINVTTVYAAGSKAAELHDALYQDMETTVAEACNDVALEEHYLPAEADTTYDALEYANPEAELIMPALNEQEQVAINWTVTPGVRKVSTTFYVKAGQKIAISTMATPNNNTYWIGIMDPVNDVRYVEGTGSLAHEFAISTSGRYRVLVQNRSNSDITAMGSYMFYTP